MGELLHLLEGILDENRVVFMALVEQKETDDANDDAAADEVERETVLPVNKSAAAEPSTGATSV